MEAEAGRLGRWLWHENGPLLGPVARYGAARSACVSSLNRTAGLDQLPAVLRAAAAIDARVDAASFFARTAVLLPANSPLTLAEARRSERVSTRRSCRSPDREVLAVANAGLVARVMVDLAPSEALAERFLVRLVLRLLDLAPSEALAERFLVRLVLRLEDATRRQTAIRAMGEGAFIEAARLRPAQSDAFGELYLVGPARESLTYVKVIDASPGPDGVCREHWLSVPPYVATAHEGVAWTFGMSESEYAPAAES